MYIRRKVFSLGEGNIDYDYNIYQQLYSEAFEDGVDYAIEKMFNEEEEKKPSKTPYVIGGTVGGILGGQFGSGFGAGLGAKSEIKRLAKERGKDLSSLTREEANSIASSIKNNPAAMARVRNKSTLGAVAGLGTAIGGTMALYNRAKKKMNKKDGE